MDQLLLTPEEAAKSLRISRTKLYELKSRNQIRFVKIGHTLRFRPQDLEEVVTNLAEAARREAHKHKFELP